MATYKELLAQREALEKQIEAQRKSELSEAISKVTAIVQEFGLTSEDVFPTTRSKNANTGSKVAPKYRDPATGQTWTGRGKPPKWIADAQDRTPFEIKAEA